MKKVKILFGLACMLLVACQSNDSDLLLPEDENPAVASQEIAVRQITDDVNSAEVDNLPFPLNEWLSSVMDDVAESKSLPADSLQKIAAQWRKYDGNISTGVESYRRQVV